MTVQPRKNYHFIFYDERLNLFWIFPSLELIKFSHVNKKGKNVGKHHIMLTGRKKGIVYPLEKFKYYVNNFDLLKI